MSSSALRGWPAQGDVLVSDPSPLTGERELHVVVSADVYNAGDPRVVLLAEIETGTRYRATAFATETAYGIALADRVMWQPMDLIGEPFGRLMPDQRERLIEQIVTILRGR